MQPQQPKSNNASGSGQQVNYSQPVAYDNQGRPLYAHPTADSEGQPQMVYVAQPLNPEKPQVSDRILQKCEESKRKYPNLNLSYGEYVISAVKRHPIGLFKIWGFVILLILVFGVSTSLFVIGSANGDSTLLESFGMDQESTKLIGTAIMILISVLGLSGGFAATYVYNANRFYLTNESVIQHIQTSLFSMHEQTVSLHNIEDASYEQQSVIQKMFNYGRIRLSTQGDETTYRFTYVTNPKKEIATLNNAVEAFKNGRPLAEEEYADY